MLISVVVVIDLLIFVIIVRLKAKSLSLEFLIRYQYYSVFSKDLISAKS